LEIREREIRERERDIREREHRAFKTLTKVHSSRMRSKSRHRSRRRDKSRKRGKSRGRRRKHSKRERGKSRKRRKHRDDTSPEPEVMEVGSDDAVAEMPVAAPSQKFLERQRHKKEALTSKGASLALNSVSASNPLAVAAAAAAAAAAAPADLPDAAVPSSLPNYKGDTQATMGISFEEDTAEIVVPDDVTQLDNTERRRYFKTILKALKGNEEGPESAEPHYRAGLCYLYNIGVEEATKNATRAVGHFLKAAGHKHNESLYNLGCMFYYGFEGKEPDHVTSFKFMKKAAQFFHGPSQNALAVMFWKGIGIVSDESTACYWWKKSANKGVVEAMVSFGKCYFLGQGIDMDHEAAKKQWRLAAEKGSGVAQALLADKFDTGPRTVVRLKKRLVLTCRFDNCPCQNLKAAVGSSRCQCGHGTIYHREMEIEEEVEEVVNEVSDNDHQPDEEQDQKDADFLAWQQETGGDEQDAGFESKHDSVDTGIEHGRISISAKQRSETGDNEDEDEDNAAAVAALQADRLAHSQPAPTQADDETESVLEALAADRARREELARQQREEQEKRDRAEREERLQLLEQEAKAAQEEREAEEARDRMERLRLAAEEREREREREKERQREREEQVREVMTIQEEEEEEEKHLPVHSEAKYESKRASVEESPAIAVVATPPVQRRGPAKEAAFFSFDIPQQQQKDTSQVEEAKAVFQTPADRKPSRQHLLRGASGVLSPRATDQVNAHSLDGQLSPPSGSQLAVDVDSLKKRAAENDPEALCEYGILKLQGTHGVEKDPEQAHHLFTLAAKQKHVQSFVELAKCQIHATGCAKDVATAIQFLKAAAKCKNTEAQFLLGKVFWKKSPKLASDWYKIAAASGHAESNFLMGYLYMKGPRDIPVDHEQAKKHYTAACKSGHVGAAQRLMQSFAYTVEEVEEIAGKRLDFDGYKPSMS